ncbi:MAG: phasin family protein [Azonexus sp.]|jgi:phasin family protein
MNFKPQDLANAGIGSISLLANATIDGIERLAALNLSAGRSFVEASFANVNALFGVTDVQSFVNLQQKLAAPVLEKGMEYSRNVIAITSETKDKIAKEVETQVAAVNANVSGLVEKALASAPAGSEVAVAAVKTAIKSANEAYEGLNKAAKQAVEVAEANVAAATQATMKAANVAAPKAAAKKAA